MRYRAPADAPERELLKRFTFASQHLFQCDWHPRLSVHLWEAAFVRGHSIDLIMLSGRTGAWAAWSLRPVFQNFAHMRRHLQDEKYFMGYQEMQNEAGQRCKYAILDILKLGQKGIDVSYFYGSDDILENQS